MKRKEIALPEVIRAGRGVTANVLGAARPQSGLSGTGEFWNCVKRTPLAEADKCFQHLLTQDGKEIEVDIFGKHKIPVKFELKPDWLWFAAGFLTAWILKH